MIGDGDGGSAPSLPKRDAGDAARLPPTAPRNADTVVPVNKIRTLRVRLGRAPGPVPTLPGQRRPTETPIFESAVRVKALPVHPAPWPRAAVPVLCELELYARGKPA